MRRALAGRLVFALALVALAFVGVFVVTGLAPGDPIDGGLLPERAVAAARERLGLNQPLLARLAARLARLAVLDLGISLRYNEPVLGLVVQRTVATLHAGATALLLALAIGIPAGVVASRTRSGVVRHAISLVSIVLLSLPALVVALVLAALASGTGLPALAVMVIALALPAAALIERLQARAMDVAQGEICLEAARARGVPRRAITWRHAWPLSLPSVLGLLGTIAGQLMSGALAIELVTGRSGLGLLTFEALMARDVNLAAACAAAVALIVGLVTVSADAIQMWMDPRVSMLTRRTCHEGRRDECRRRVGASHPRRTRSRRGSAAPWLATSDVSSHHPDLALAAPSLARRVLVERLPPTYRTLDEPLPLVWLSGTLVRSTDATEPFLPLGSDSLGRDQWTRLLHGAPALAGPHARGPGRGRDARHRGRTAGRRRRRLDGHDPDASADLFLAWPALYVVLVLRAAMPLSLSFACSSR